MWHAKHSNSPCQTGCLWQRCPSDARCWWFSAQAITCHLWGKNFTSSWFVYGVQPEELTLGTGTAHPPPARPPPPVPCLQPPPQRLRPMRSTPRAECNSHCQMVCLRGGFRQVAARRPGPTIDSGPVGGLEAPVRDLRMRVCSPDTRPFQPAVPRPDSPGRRHPPGGRQRPDNWPQSTRLVSPIQGGSVYSPHYTTCTRMAGCHPPAAVHPCRQATGLSLPACD